ncbi:hypothetical protein U9M48_020122 [Paspalum notatum var. saurae]|uniref:Uncharacterized protein n=1 Tax=Paspalum notatum var. saurae TaxID=547442 RepID=A0AAQ3WRD2_PASNO
MAPPDDVVEELVARRRAGGLAPRPEEADADAARGWSSAVLERGLTLRRRGGAYAASCSSRPRGGLVVGTAGAAARAEPCFRREKDAAPPGALGVGAEEYRVDPGVKFGLVVFCPVHVNVIP